MSPFEIERISSICMHLPSQRQMQRRMWMCQNRYNRERRVSRKMKWGVTVRIVGVGSLKRLRNDRNQLNGVHDADKNNIHYGESLRKMSPYLPFVVNGIMEDYNGNEIRCGNTK